MSKAKDKAMYKTEKHIRDNSLVIYGLNKGDDPNEIKEFLRNEVNSLIRDKDLISKFNKRGNILLEKQLQLRTQTNSVNFQPPMFSIHIPGDLNSASYLIDEFNDGEKIAQFCLEKLKLNHTFSDELCSKAMIPFSQRLNKNKRRMVDRKLLVAGKSFKAQFCEYNY